MNTKTTEKPFRLNGVRKSLNFLFDGGLVMFPLGHAIAYVMSMFLTCGFFFFFFFGE